MQRTNPVWRILKCGAVSISHYRYTVGLSLKAYHSKCFRARTRCYVGAGDRVRNFHHTSRLEVDDTIYALSTAPGRAAIAVIRVSGSACQSIYQQLCPRKPLPKPRVASLRTLQSPVEANRTIDSGALIVFFPGPKTVTGEDVLELHVHGGPAIVRSVLEAVAQSAETGKSMIKIRPAEPGEFTKRAFYNGRIDLAEVEALGDALAAETEQQRRLAVSGGASGLTQRYEQWRSMLLYARGELEALIDFSEDQHFDESPTEFIASISKQIVALKQYLELHIVNSSRGELLRNGISVALLGAPNAGKSSLLNRIVGREAAIVSAEEGTTRDIVDVTVDMQGWLVRLGDMAGLRATNSVSQLTNKLIEQRTKDVISNVGGIEREGIRRAKERALQSDLVIVLISLQVNSEGSAELTINEELVTAIQQCHQAGKEIQFVINKIDLLHKQTGDRKISISKLLSELIQLFPQIDPNDVFCVSCKEAEQFLTDDTDPGGLQTFLAGLKRKFEMMTLAAMSVDELKTSFSSQIEAQNYWTASLSVTHRQNVYLQECLIHLQNFLEISSTDSIEEPLMKTSERPGAGPGTVHSPTRDLFDTNPAIFAESPSQQRLYHVDNHYDIVGAIEDPATGSFNTLAERRSYNIPQTSSTYPATIANSCPDFGDNGEVDIVTAAEHLRHAADCLAKLTGRGEGVSSGADVEDVLGVVFEK